MDLAVLLETPLVAGNKQSGRERNTSAHTHASYGATEKEKKKK